MSNPINKCGVSYSIPVLICCKAIGSESSLGSSHTNLLPLVIKSLLNLYKNWCARPIDALKNNFSEK